jgi:hypothetical protein
MAKLNYLNSTDHNLLFKKNDCAFDKFLAVKELKVGLEMKLKHKIEH